MKICVHNQSREQGSVLLISLTIGVILLVAMASYMMMLSSQKTLITRSETWNAALTVAEAGIEEGLAQVNQNTTANFFTNINNPNNIFTNFGNNGWSASGTYFSLPTSASTVGLPPVARTLQVAGDNNALGYNVFIVGGSPPTIYATGYATVPIVGHYISREVKITTLLEPLIANAITAKSNLLANGNKNLTGSYNPYNTNLSTGGLLDPLKESTNGSIAVGSGTVDLGNKTVEGNEYMGAGVSTNKGGTVTGTTYTDYNVQVPDVVMPSNISNWTLAAPSNNTPVAVLKNGNITTNTINAYNFTTPGNYTVNQDLPIVVAPGVKVYLNVTSTTYTAKGMYIEGGQANSGTAVLYFNGPTSVVISGNTDVNASNRADSLWYFGSPSLTSITFNGSADFYGVIYAPEADLKMNGGGSPPANIIGSVTVNNFDGNGGVKVIYDESLATSGPNRGYVANSWIEY